MLNYKIYNSTKNSNDICWVFIAGFTGSYAVWYPLLDIILKQQNIPILLIDNLGAGTSPQPKGEYSTKNMADLIIDIIKQLEINRINLVGHSMGGCIAQHIALITPEKINKLFLLSTAYKFDKITTTFLINRYELADAGVNKTLIAKVILPSLFNKNFLEDPNKIQMTINRVVNNTQTLDGLYGQLYACITHDTSSLIGQIKCKTCIITGGEDLLVHPRNSTHLKEQLENSEIFVINNAAHMIQLEQPSILSQILLTN